uniref:Kielin cysteine rich BMP regulator n=1 Tax=Lepisosteus oculatus TaxID=7918 RepID=W5NEV9_LEPOC
MSSRIVILFLQVCAVAFWNFFLITRAHTDSPLQYYEDENVIDLLEALNITRSIKGVTKAKGLDPSIPAWKFRQRVPHLTLPRDFSFYFLSTMQGSIGFHFVAQQTKNSDGTLISFVSPTAMKKDGHPLLQLVSSTRSNQLRLDYRAVHSMDPAHILFPGGTPFSNSKWARVALNLEAHKISLFVDCEEPVVFEKSHGEDVLSLSLPIDLEITFASMPGDKNSKFAGYWQTAEVSTSGFLRRPWHCENLSGTKPCLMYSNYSHCTQYTRILEIPETSSPNGLDKFNPENQEKRMRRLEQTVESLSMMLDMVKAQNADLLSRVAFLESCECRRLTCSWEGREIEEGAHWEKDQHVSCVCVKGEVQCTVTDGEFFKRMTYSSCEKDCHLRANQANFKDIIKYCIPPNITVTLLYPCDFFCPRSVFVIADNCLVMVDFSLLKINRALLILFFVKQFNKCFIIEMSSILFYIPYGIRRQTLSNPFGLSSCLDKLCIVRFSINRTSCQSNLSERMILEASLLSSWNKKQREFSCRLYKRENSDICINIYLHNTFKCQKLSKACDLDGRPNNNEQSFTTLDGCQKCTCKNGNVLCSRVSCPALDCTVPETVPGECCPKCRGCIHYGIHYEHQSKWRLPDNPCTICTCVGGEVVCEKEKCTISCRNPPEPRPGSCCPVCDGCKINGQEYLNGDIVPAGDRCADCVCVNGDAHCNPIPCPETPCRNAVQRPGECCPRCEECEYESQTFVDGQEFISTLNPCLRCRCLAGKVSCERLDLNCAPVRCSHPAKPRGQCCPTCDMCEYERRLYHTGKVFTPPGSIPCLKCTCTRGDVRCHQETCPPAKCSNPIIDPQQCCPICKVCVQEGVEFEEGTEWEPDDNPCSSCTCINGDSLCQVSQCHPVSCSHPTKVQGDCCATCDQCTYNQRIYNNGQDFIDPDNPCQNCRCQDGTVQCIPLVCPPVTCSKPQIKAGQCCPKCPDCVFENRVFVDGEEFPSPVSQCQTCVCSGGRVSCENRDCPRPSCSYPLPGSCCQSNCNGCNYAGKEYPNGMEFPHPFDQCRTCHCINGNVQCLSKRCPPLLCVNPFHVPEECCPQCPVPPAECLYAGQPYKHTQRFYDPLDKCRICMCSNGTVACHRKNCVPVQCANPIMQDCCRTCDVGCLYNGKEFANGEQFADVSDPCGKCVCQEGTVSCEKRPCPVMECPFPVQTRCCQACDGCNYIGDTYLNGQEFTDSYNQCNHCVCTNGFVTCSPKPCYNPGCTHPITLPGKCCPVCEGCFYSNVAIINGQTFQDPADPCSQCTCRAGSVQCMKRLCPPAFCSHPVIGPCDCPICEGCVFLGTVYADGETFKGPNGDCEDCTCFKGDVTCGPKKCSKVTCPHPGMDVCSCPLCEGCHFNDRDCKNEERFIDPKNKCQRCTCLNGGVTCVPVTCPSVFCRNPVTPPGECCPVCTGICHYLGQLYESGTIFDSPTDVCSKCTCLNEVVTCQRRPCPHQCSHPVPSTACCPACDACFFEGITFSNRETFSSPSNPCQRCSCLKGNVVCTPLVCPQIPCPNPVTKPGQCCPECPVCFETTGVTYSDGESFTLNNCRQCSCSEGNVHCANTLCPRLNCMHQVTEPGACCPGCRGCVYNGREYDEGSTWFASTTPCMSCMCVDGVTTCSDIRCVSSCVNEVHVPGECCPVCADCVFGDRVYGPGDSFHPSDDPCEICTCEVMPDGEQHLRCYRKQCPSLVDCPKNLIQFPGPDLCCPVCAQPLSNCTIDIVGNEIPATDDPCYTCQCKDLTWVCIHQGCLPLSCPISEQFTPEDSCCPICDECIIEAENRRVSNGESWTDSIDECITCTCNLGYIECNIEECTPVICQDGLVKVKSPGQCCYECQDPNISCMYQGNVYQSNEHWEVDECTTCTCVSGEVHCQTERCPQVSCASDETPALIPGMCCPHCIPRPATCIAFGDPHYRTFDGKMIHFQGACTYVLAEDCEGGDFSIHATNDDRGRKGVSWTKEVTVLIGDVVVKLLQDWVVMVDYQTVTLPFLKEPYVYVERKTNIILLNTNIGVKVLWNGKSHLEVSVPGTYKGHMCGICGNFNNYPQDDMRIRTGQIVLSEAAFGNSWKVQSENHTSVQCRDGEDIDPCKEAGYSARKTANSKCSVLKTEVFEPCHAVIPPEMFFASCVYDLCACGSNVEDCLCDALEAYASECREAGVILHWRSPALCAVGCPQDRGFIFDECGPPCPKTCFNKDVPLGVIEAHCFKPCVPGCQCPAGLVEHESHCIPPEACPKIIYGNM